MVFLLLAQEQQILLITLHQLHYTLIDNSERNSLNETQYMPATSKSLNNVVPTGAVHEGPCLCRDRVVPTERELASN